VASSAGQSAQSNRNTFGRASFFETLSCSEVANQSLGEALVRAADIRPLPITDAVCNRVLILPTGTAVSGDDIRFVCGLIRQTLEDRAHPARRCLA